MTPLSSDRVFLPNFLIHDDDHDACNVINEDDKEDGGDRDEEINKDAERGRGGGGGRSAL